MARFLKLVLVAPFAILFLIFAFANRHFVTVSFDPFASGDVPAFAVQAPLFVVLIGAIMIGVLAGGAATWLAQGRYRRAARQNRADADRWRAEAERAKAQTVAPVVPSTQR
jgi:uncharacterized integral membrane protein